MASGALGNANAKAKVFRKPFIYTSLISQKDSFMQKYYIKIEFLAEQNLFIYLIPSKGMMKILTSACPCIFFFFHYFCFS